MLTGRDFAGKALVPGVALCAAIALFSMLLAHVSHLPAVLLALVLGFGVQLTRLSHKLAAHQLGEGINFSARSVLRLGIVFVGAKLTLTQIVALGWPALMTALLEVVLVLTGGILIARAFGHNETKGALFAGSVAICGASAALAISSVTPPSTSKDRDTALTIAIVTVLSTLVMFAYPALAMAMGLSDRQAGVFLGASIHDLTQVVGAGALISPDAMSTATATKLVRVACLAPVLFLLRQILFRQSEGQAKAPFPWFIIGFLVVAATANVGFLPSYAIAGLSEFSTFALIMSAGAIGLKTNHKALLSGGMNPLLSICAITVLCAAISLFLTKILIS